MHMCKSNILTDLLRNMAPDSIGYAVYIPCVYPIYRREIIRKCNSFLCSYQQYHINLSLIVGFVLQASK